MRTYPVERWLRLGKIIARARVEAGFGDTKDWVARIGRSDRVLLGLERGEHTGQHTLRLIEAAIGWPVGSCEDYLSGGPEPAQRSTVRPSAEGADVAHLRDPLRDGLDEQAERELERQAALLRLDVERRRQGGAR